MKLDKTVDEVAALIGGEVQLSCSPDGEPTAQVGGQAGARGAGWHLARLLPPDQAGPNDLAVVFRADLTECAAGCLVVGPDSRWTPGPERCLVRVADPEAAFDLLAALGHGAESGAGEGVHPSAVLAADAQVHPSSAVGPFVYVGPGARVGPRCELGPGVVLGAEVELGEECRLHAQVVIERGCVLGRRVIVHAGSVLGADGFGYRQQDGRHVKSPQVGIVRVGDDVEIGAHCTIDRARLGATVIGAGCKLDDQVHVAHNCQLGEGCALAAQVGLAGGVVLGRGVLVGGQAGVSDGLAVGDAAILGGAAVVFQDVAEGTFVLGLPARDHRRFKREVLSLKRLPDLIARQRRGSEPSGS